MVVTTAQVPPGWVRVPGDADGIPLWQWQGEPVYAATRDMDQLRFIGAALTRFDEMDAEEFHHFVSSQARSQDVCAPAGGKATGTQD